MMKLTKFRVLNFKSVDDSGWIDCDDVTALIGTNEAGKTNVLLPLWKLNPAKEGGIVPTSDYPRKLYNEFRHKEPKPVFIRAQFEASDDFAEHLAKLTGMKAPAMRKIEVARRFDSKFDVDFPDALPIRKIHHNRLSEILEKAETEIQTLTPLKTEEELKKLLLSSIQTAKESVSGNGHELDEKGMNAILSLIEGVKTDGAPKTSSIVPRHQQLGADIKGLLNEISHVHPKEVPEAVELVLKNLPKFVYYSTYGNLDSEIYLPHVIQNLERKDLGIKELAKARTLKVLFEFVKLLPKEILELGKDFKEAGRQPTESEIAIIAEKKKERSILLQSASTMLTNKFREWWKQGEYRFRFEADGEHFRIWVSDDKRPEEVELEGRSTGLQWFLSFYLVFLVERVDAHEGAILLLDEPGLSLHPLAQRDLSEFFDGLSNDNQLLYTCHSPFLIDADRLERARKVYVGRDGTSKVTSDLREMEGEVGQRGAAYAVHAAVGLTVAESLLLGCSPVVVEGVSDQHYLTTIKILLINAGRLKPGRELVFPPAGGAKGVKAISTIISGRDDELPVALFDSDEKGTETVESLRSGLYSEYTELVFEVGDFVKIEGAEVEDLLPQSVIVNAIDRLYHTKDEVRFADEVKEGNPIVPQIKAWAIKHGVNLNSPGWKVGLAKKVKQQLLLDGFDALDSSILDIWEKMFTAFQISESKAAEVESAAS